MNFTLRPYQNDAVQGLYNFWKWGLGDHGLIVAPTGSGKSLILAQIIKDALSYDDTRVMVLTHVKELLEQNAATVSSLIPDLDYGFYSAGIGQKVINRRVTFAGIQSIYEKAHLFFPTPDLLIIDEAHLIPTNSETRYGHFIEQMLICNPHVKIIGLTATPYRMGTGMLHEGTNALFDGICYDIPVRHLMEEGYLSRLVSRGSINKIDLTNVHSRGGEFIASEVQAAASVPDLVAATCYEIIDLGVDRKSWLLFCAGVNHAQMVHDRLTSNGISVRIVTGETPKDERAETLRLFKSGQIRCICNVGVLTTGFDAPNTDLVALIRSTASTSLYVQMAGRGTRPVYVDGQHDIKTREGRLAAISDGPKPDCLLLDFGGNIERHGMFDAVNPSRQSSGGSGDGEPLAKCCPRCDAMLGISEKTCFDCGYEFPEPEPNHDATSYDGAVTSDQIVAEWFDVENVDYVKWKKRNNPDNKPDTLRITYDLGLISISEWVCPDHEGFARTKFEARKATWGATANTLNECIAESNSWVVPGRIKVEPDGRFHKIVQFDYSVPFKVVTPVHEMTHSEINDALDEIPF